MKRGSLVVAAWGFNLFVLWTVAWLFFEPDTETLVMLPVSFTVIWFLAAWALLRERRAGTPGDPGPEAIHDASQSTALAGAAIIGLFFSAQFGPWLTFISGGALLVAIAGLVREHRAARETLKRVQEHRR